MRLGSGGWDREGRLSQGEDCWTRKTTQFYDDVHPDFCNLVAHVGHFLVNTMEESVKVCVLQNEDDEGWCLLVCRAKSASWFFSCFPVFSLWSSCKLVGNESIPPSTDYGKLQFVRPQTAYSGFYFPTGASIPLTPNYPLFRFRWCPCGWESKSASLSSP